MHDLSSNLLHRFHKFILGKQRFIPHFQTIVIHRLGRIMKEVSNLPTICNTQSDQSKDAQLGCQQFTLLRTDTLIFLKQSIELFYELRIEFQEHTIERVELTVLYKSSNCPVLILRASIFRCSSCLLM